MVHLLRNSCESPVLFVMPEMVLYLSFTAIQRFPPKENQSEEQPSFTSLMKHLRLLYRSAFTTNGKRLVLT